MNRGLALSLLMIVPILAGCVEQTGPDATDSADEEPAAVVMLPQTDKSSNGTAADSKQAPVPARIENGTVHIDVPLDVVLIGYPDDTAQALAAQLTPFSVDQRLASIPRLNEASSLTMDRPIVPTATMRILQTPASSHGAWLAALESAGSEHIDGNAAEAWMADHLHDLGAAPEPARPSLVLVHQGSDARPYRYEYENGVRESVRIFGGAEPLIIADPSAPADPLAGAGHAYRDPISSDAVEALVELVHDAIQYRFLQGAIYPPTTAPCHAVTVVLAYRMTAATDQATRPVDEHIDADGLQAAFARLTGDPVHVDVSMLALPVDDPALEALTRAVTAGFLPYIVHPLAATSTTVGMQAVREWMELNWEDYHVDHAGCEEYLTLQILGDMGDLHGHGIALYDAGGSRRFSYGLAPEACRAFYEVGLGDAPHCLGTEGLESFAWVQLLSLHETGHLLGLPHPHNINTPGGVESLAAFAAVRTSMSYHTQDRALGFGAIDEANWQRNRAGFVVAQAAASGASGLAPALEAMGSYQWNEAAELARAALDATQTA